MLDWFKAIFIPEGAYCYRTIYHQDGHHITKLCRYFQTIVRPDGTESAYCRYCNVWDDIVLNDQCKVCGVNKV